MRQKRKLKQRKIKQPVHRNTLSSFCVGQLPTTTEHRVYPEVWLISPVWLNWKKKKKTNWFFCCQWASITNKLLVKGRILCPLSPFSVGILSGLNSGPCTASVNLCVLVLFGLKDTVSWDLSSGCYNISASSSYRSLTLEGRGLMSTFRLELRAPKSFLLYTLWSCGSLCLSTSTERSFFDKGWASHWSMDTVVCHYKSFLCSFSTIIVLGFPLVPWAVWSHFLGYFSNIRYKFCILNIIEK